MSRPCILTETPQDGAVRTAERIREGFHALALRQRGADVAVTASFGVATTSDGLAETWTPASLVSLADSALYAAKRSGRDRVCTASGQERSATSTVSSTSTRADAPAPMDAHGHAHAFRSD